MLQQSQINNWDDLFNRLTIFILECNGEQIRYAAQSFAELCHLFADQLIKKGTTNNLIKFQSRFNIIVISCVVFYIVAI